MKSDKVSLDYDINYENWYEPLGMELEEWYEGGDVFHFISSYGFFSSSFFEHLCKDSPCNPLALSIDAFRQCNGGGSVFFIESVLNQLFHVDILEIEYGGTDDYWFCILVEVILQHVMQEAFYEEVYRKGHSPLHIVSEVTLREIWQDVNLVKCEEIILNLLHHGFDENAYGSVMNVFRHHMIEKDYSRFGCKDVSDSYIKNFMVYIVEYSAKKFEKFWEFWNFESKDAVTENYVDAVTHMLSYYWQERTEYVEGCIAGED